MFVSFGGKKKKKNRNRKPTGFEYFKNSRIIEPPVLGISNPSKNHKLS
jgi:hypothetical protein